METKPEKLDSKSTSSSPNDKQSTSESHVDSWDLIDEEDDVVKWAGIVPFCFVLRPKIISYLHCRVNT